MNRVSHVRNDTLAGHLRVDSRVYRTYIYRQMDQLKLVHILLKLVPIFFLFIDMMFVNSFRLVANYSGSQKGADIICHAHVFLPNEKLANALGPEMENGNNVLSFPILVEKYL